MKEGLGLQTWGLVPELMQDSTHWDNDTQQQWCTGPPESQVMIAEWVGSTQILGCTSSTVVATQVMMQALPLGS